MTFRIVLLAEFDRRRAANRRYSLRSFARSLSIDHSNDRGINGGVWPSPPEGHNLVQLFVEVDDVK